MPALVDALGRPLRGGGRPAAQAAGYWSAPYLAGSLSAQEFAGWTPGTWSADAEVWGDRQRIVDRARDLARNDAVVAGAVRAQVDAAIGAGLRLQALPDYRALGLDREAGQGKARELEALWQEWAEQPECCDAAGVLDFAGLTRQAAASDLIAGESLALVLWLPERQRRLGSRFATIVQMVEPDRLSTPAGRVDGPRLRDGIELDEFGAPVAYHLRVASLGDALSGLAAPEELMRWERVTRRTAMGRRQVLHGYDQRRSSQHRGVSALAPVMAALKMRDRYQRAELQAAVVNAVIAAVRELPLDGAALADLFGGPDGAAKLAEARNAAPAIPLGLGPGGLIPQLAPGERLSGFNAARPAAQFDPFMVSVLRLIAAGLNMTYETLARDFSRTNYSSARAALLEAARFILVWRVWKTAVWCRPIYELVIEEAVWRGLIDLPGFETDRAARRAWLRSAWMGPGRGWIDPVKEIQAAAMRIRLGISSLRDEAAEQGRDWLELLDQLALEQDELAERGLVLPTVAFAPASDTPQPEEAPVP